MNNHATTLALAFLIVLAGSATQVFAGTPCTPTRIKDDEAQKLLTAALQAQGEDPYALYYQPTGLPTDRFLQFMVNGPGECADGCLVGYFAVDRVTARVLDTVLIREETGPALKALQTQLRASHCISDGMVLAAQDTWP